MNRLNKYILLGYVLTISLLFVLWEAIASKNNTLLVLISSPSHIAVYFKSNFTGLITAAAVTFIEALIGLLIAVIFSFITVVFCFIFPKLINILLPVMIVNQVIPLITLAPLLIILFGDGMGAKIVMSSLLCYFPVFVNFINSYRLIGENIHDLMVVYNAGTAQKIFKVYFPLSMPGIMAGLKISATLSVIAAIVAEFNGADIGLGKNLFLAAKRLEPELMMSSLFLAALAGGTMFIIIYLIERRFGKWYLLKS